MAIRIDYSPSETITQLARAMGAAQGDQRAVQQLAVHNQMVENARRDVARRESMAIESALQAENLDLQRQRQAAADAQQAQRLELERGKQEQQQRLQAQKQEETQAQQQAISQLDPEVQKLVRAGVRPPADVISPDQSDQGIKPMTAGQQQEAVEFALREVERLRKDAEKVRDDILSPPEAKTQAEQVLNTPYEAQVQAQIERLRMAQRNMFPQAPAPVAKPVAAPVQQTPQSAGSPQAVATRQVLAAPTVQRAFEEVLQTQFQQMVPPEIQSPQAFARFRQDVLANLGSRGPLNPATASIFLSQSGGDKDRARALALFSGFTIPQ